MAAQCTRKKLEYHRNYTINPKCCIKPPDLQCAGDFNPPLLGTSTDFCTEALAKGLPIQECSLIKPQKLVIAAEEAPEGIRVLNQIILLLQFCFTVIFAPKTVPNYYR